MTKEMEEHCNKLLQPQTASRTMTLLMVYGRPFGAGFGGGVTAREGRREAMQ